MMMMMMVMMMMMMMMMHKEIPFTTCSQESQTENICMNRSYWMMMIVRSMLDELMHLWMNVAWWMEQQLSHPMSQQMRNWKIMVLTGICIMCPDEGTITEFEDGMQIRKGECKEINLHRCMVDSLDHHEWHVIFLKRRIVDHHGCLSLSLHCMVDDSDHHEWYLHGIHVFQCLWYCS